jgi:hypothetical protein
VDWLNLPVWADLGMAFLFDEKIDGLLKLRLKVGILGGSVTLMGLSAGKACLFAI